MPARIILGADLVPTESNKDLFEAGNAKQLVGEELLEKLNNADFAIFNLEVPLTDEQHSIVKCGPNLIAPTETIKGLKAINPHFFGLANNHILDQGRCGLESTIRVLEEAGIEYSGVGANLSEASKPYIKEICGKRIGIYCCAEHEFSIATESTMGANPFDPLESLDHVEALKNIVDYVIVLYHGGKEHYRYPSPYLQKVCRRLVDKGADLVICQHSHCIGCEEEYKAGTIVYGQGNFLFDDSDNECWQTGLLIELDEKFEISYTPIVKRENLVRIADEKKREEIIEQFRSRSEKIKDPGFVRENYSDFADQMERNYLFRFSGLFGKNLLVRIINKFTSYRFLKKFYPTERITAIENVLDCEAHRELALEAMKRGRR